MQNCLLEDGQKSLSEVCVDCGIRTKETTGRCFPSTVMNWNFALRACICICVLMAVVLLAHVSRSQPSVYRTDSFTYSLRVRYDNMMFMLMHTVTDCAALLRI